VVGLFDADGAPSGVAALDVSIDHILDTLLASPVDAPVEAYLVDAKGRTVVHTSMERDGSVRDLPPYPRTDLLVQMRDQPSGHAFTDDGKLVVWTPLDAIGWTYVVEGDADALLE
jgi:hypothetical protein